MSARLRVVHAGPLVTLQDSGRPGNMRFGVPNSGPMDRRSHAAANLVVGNDRDLTAVEVSLGGLTIEAIDAPVTVSIVGGEFDVRHDDHRQPSWTVLILRRGERLTIRAGRSGSWTYLGFAGRVVASAWLGHTATHSTSGFGGGQLRAGQELLIDAPRIEDRRVGDVPRPVGKHGPARVVLGPQDQHFAPGSIDALFAEEFRFSSAFDRMGVRLDGPALALRDVLSIPSEPIVRGSLQVAGDSVATLLFADHQTTGGYPKIATVISPDLDELAQKRPGDPVRFERVTPTQAVDIARAAALEQDEYLRSVERPGRTLAHRLMQENLIGTHPTPDD